LIISAAVRAKYLERRRHVNQTISDADAPPASAFLNDLQWVFAVAAWDERTEVVELGACDETHEAGNLLGRGDLQALAFLQRCA
jgi:hypothetical protein